MPPDARHQKPSTLSIEEAPIATTASTIKGAIPPAADKPADNGQARPKPQWPSGDGVEWVRRSL